MFDLIFSIGGFVWNFLKKVMSLFAGIPSQLLVLVGGLSAVVAEVVSFGDSVLSFFDSMSADLVSLLSGVGSAVGDSQVFMFFCYCLAFDTLVGVVGDVLTFAVSVITFLFVAFVHVVLIFFGLRYGYEAYKFLVRSFSGGLARA